MALSVLQLQSALQNAQLRNESAFTIIGEVSGIQHSRIKEIADGATPTESERMILESLADLK